MTPPIPARRPPSTPGGIDPAPLRGGRDPAPLRSGTDHWRRFRNLMLIMTIAAIGTAAVAIWQMRVAGVPFRLHFLIAMGGGIVITLLLAGGLMGLAFVSSRSGHDESVSAPDD